MPVIGLFGGTFDPPHNGHLVLAAEARAQLGLERLLWVLTPDPPHKQGRSLTAIEHRLEMLERAIHDEPADELSRVEIDRPGPHYALDTVNLVKEREAGAQLVYLMGGDSLHDLPDWHRPAEFVLACSALGVMRRPGDAIDLPALERSIPGISEKVRFIEAPLLEISSSDIRRRIAAGLPFRHFLPAAVYAYILEHGLYR
jgi:nicotinate-nucleotide adenylyltransferase